MTIDIDRLSEPELLNLNRLIVERLKMMHQLRAHAAMMEFQVGEQVYFRDNSGVETCGVLTKYNKKTVTVITSSGHQWNISPTLLYKVKEDDIVEVAPDSAIELKAENQ